MAQNLCGVLRLSPVVMWRFRGHMTVRLEYGTWIVVSCYPLSRDTPAASVAQVLSWSFDGTLKLWDLERFQPLRTFIGHERSVVGAMFLNQERSVLSWSNDATLKLWDLGTGQLMHTFSGHRLGIKGVRALAFDRVLSWSHDGGMKIWDLRSQTLVRSLAGSRGPRIGHCASGIW